MGTTSEPANDLTPTPGTAAEWCVALTEEPADPDLHRRFHAWLDASPAHAADWAEISHTVAVMARLPTANTAPRRWRAAPVVAALAACLVLAMAAPSLVRHLTADQATGTGEVRTLRLADGSTVHLGPQSAINVEDDSGGRRVRLLRGEAFFEVTHDAAHPFAVRTRDAVATDIGTAFEVRMDDTGTSVAVREGRVRVAGDAGPPVDLGAGQAARVTAGTIRQDQVSPDEVAAWTQGQIVAKNQPVAAVVDALRPYFRGVILVRGGDLARQPLTGVYNTANPVAALRAVAQAQGASVRQITPWVLVLSAG
ncbi:MAG: FecR domain-containing protein [Azospirillaceae bacterium]|nr:FecR domain-containing protein [Azospirillaceae bacterium]